MGYIPFKETSPIYGPDDIIRVLDMSVNKDMLVTAPVKGPDKVKVRVYNVPASLDIETTSFMDGEDKCACMYIWMFGINGNVIIGREWADILKMFDTIVEHLGLSPERQLPVYVHNLAFEFQFIRKRFEWSRVFAIENRRPVEAVTVTGIDFKCSYILSGYALGKLDDELQKYHVEKMEGDLDYSLFRHSKTPMTEKELKYCENDVRVVMAYIQEQIEKERTDKEPNGNITKIPLTKTGYVRRYCRDACLYANKSHKKGSWKFRNYHELMEGMTIADEVEYKRLKEAFQGGFTHANAYYSGITVPDVASYDFGSSYPYVMVSEMFPMSKGRIVKIHSLEEFEGYLKRYCCLFTADFDNIMNTLPYENPISYSRCNVRGKYTIDNGRVVWADHLATTLTEQDWAIIRYAYTWDHVTIGEFRIYDKGYLPTDFVKAILKLYSDKTTLKGVKGKEIEYLFSKGLLNATYGMAVTDIIRDDHIYTADHEWKEEAANVEESLKTYNESKRRFLFYPWGVWVTAYARRNLFTGIFEFGKDYVYSDTDSVKVRNYENHLEYIERYNQGCRLKLEAACKYHSIPFDMVEPLTQKGKKKLLGVWEFEGIYKRFKTLGAKRYMVQYSDDDKENWLEVADGSFSPLAITVSGVNKKFAVPHLVEKYGGYDGAFEAFENGLRIEEEFTGKNTHIYVDEARDGLLTDYRGKVGEYHELTGLYLEPADYSLTLSGAYIDYLLGVREIEW